LNNQLLQDKSEEGGEKMRKRKGQSILEYVIVLTVIVAAVAVAAKSFLAGGISNAFSNMNKTMTNSTSQLPGAGG
jgi:Flp pilus assembly pilin Flp